MTETTTGKVTISDLLNGTEPKIETQVGRKPEVDEVIDLVDAEEATKDDVFEDDVKGDEIIQKQAGTPPEEKDEPESWTKKAVLDERRKRQALEEEIKKLKEQTEQVKSTPRKEEEEAERPNAFEDPEGALKHLEALFDQKLLNQRIIQSKQLMVDAKGEKDYSEKIAAFQEMVALDPSLNRQMEEHANPAKFAYELAEKYLENKRITDPEYAEEIRAKIREEERQKILAEFEEEREPSEKDKRKKSAVEMPDIINANSVSKGIKPVRKLRIGDLL